MTRVITGSTEVVNFIAKILVERGFRMTTPEFYQHTGKNRGLFVRDNTLSYEPLNTPGELYILDAEKDWEEIFHLKVYPDFSTLISEAKERYNVGDVVESVTTAQIKGITDLLF